MLMSQQELFETENLDHEYKHFLDEKSEQEQLAKSMRDLSDAIEKAFKDALEKAEKDIKRPKHAEAA